MCGERADWACSWAFLFERALSILSDIFCCWGLSIEMGKWKNIYVMEDKADW